MKCPHCRGTGQVDEKYWIKELVLSSMTLFNLLLLAVLLFIVIIEWWEKL